MNISKAHLRNTKKIFQIVTRFNLISKKKHVSVHATPLLPFAKTFEYYFNFD